MPDSDPFQAPVRAEDTYEDEPFDAPAWVGWMIDAPTEDAVADLRGMTLDEFRWAFREWTRTWEPAGVPVFRNPAVAATTLTVARQANAAINAQLRRYRDDPDVNQEWRKRALRARDVLGEFRQSLEQEVAAAAKAGDDPVAALAVAETEIADLAAQVKRLQQTNEKLNPEALKVRGLESRIAKLEAKNAYLQDMADEAGFRRRMGEARQEVDRLASENRTLAARVEELEASLGESREPLKAGEFAGMSREQLEQKAAQLARKTTVLNKRATIAEGKLASQGGGKKKRRR